MALSSPKHCLCSSSPASRSGFFTVSTKHILELLACREDRDSRVWEEDGVGGEAETIRRRLMIRFLREKGIKGMERNRKGGDQAFGVVLLLVLRRGIWRVEGRDSRRRLCRTIVGGLVVVGEVVRERGRRVVGRVARAVRDRVLGMRVRGLALRVGDKSLRKVRGELMVFNWLFVMDSKNDIGTHS